MMECCMRFGILRSAQCTGYNICLGTLKRTGMYVLGCILLVAEHNDRIFWSFSKLPVCVGKNTIVGVLLCVSDLVRCSYCC